MSDDAAKAAADATAPASISAEGAAAASAEAPAPASAAAESGGNGAGDNSGESAEGGKRKNQKSQQSQWQRKREQKRRKVDKRRDNNNNGGNGNSNTFRSRRNDALELKGGDPKEKGGDRIKGGWKHEDGSRGKPLNEGSFAHPAMRKCFGVEVIGFADDDAMEEEEKTDEAKNGAEKADAAGEAEKKEADSSEAAAAPTSEAGDAAAAEEPPPFAGVPPAGPKRKVSLLLAFLGTAYQGMQINSSTRSVQAEIELALYRASLLARSNFGYPHKYGWSNSARTDKGVHSCAQVCSVKIQLPKPDSTMDEVRELMNVHLPEDIRVVDVVRVTKSFCARTQRDRVRYRYMIPAYVLRERSEITDAFVTAGCADYEEREPGGPLDAVELDKVRGELGVATYRIPEDRLATFREALGKYAGTKKYHNYTKGKSPKDPSVQRYIEAFTADDPVIDANGVQWIPTSVLGQSFLLHQIRKMIAMAADVAGGTVTLDEMDDSFSVENTSRHVHVAPASGLFLEMSYFGNYNERQGRQAGSDVPPLDWASDAVKDSPAVQRWTEFKRDVVEKHVMEEEDGAGNFVTYLYALEYFFSADGGSKLRLRKREEGTEDSKGDGDEKEGTGNEGSGSDGGKDKESKQDGEEN